MQGSDGTGEFSVTKAIENSGKSLPGGSSNKKLSATQLAAAQQAVKQANEMAATNFTGPVVTGSGDGYMQARANFLLLCPYLGKAMYKRNLLPCYESAESSSTGAFHVAGVLPVPLSPSQHGTLSHPLRHN